MAVSFHLWELAALCFVCGAMGAGVAIVAVVIGDEWKHRRVG